MQHPRTFRCIYFLHSYHRMSATIPLLTTLEHHGGDHHSGKAASPSSTFLVFCANLSK